MDGRPIDDRPMASLHDAFLLPGVYGDEPQIVDFRRRMRGLVALDLVDPPTVAVLGSALSNMVATAEQVSSEIERRRPDGDISIVGYSFGASLALEVSAQLERRGRRIAFLGILDGPFDVDAMPGGHASIPRPKTVKAMIRTAVIDRTGSSEVARDMVMAAASPTLVGTVRSDMLQRAVLKNLRNKALLGWSPPTCGARGLHVHTGVYGAVNAERWHRLCPNLKQVQVSGSHEDLLTGATLEAIAAAFGTSIAEGGAPFSGQAGPRF